MACTLYCRITLNKKFHVVLNTDEKKFIIAKRKYYSVLRECVVLLFMRLNYPHNVNIGVDSALFEYGIIEADQYDTSLLVRVEVDLPAELEKEKIEEQIRARNLVPDLLKNIKVLRVIPSC